MMRLNRLDLNLFLVFDTIYTERNLTRAAERLSLTQPTVSNALARLRHALDDPLFVKSGGGMQPTSFAESIAGRVSDALTLLQSASLKAERFDPATSRRIFRLSVLDLHDAELLPDLVQDLSHRAPGVELRVLRLPRAELPKALARGTVEIATDIPLRDTTNLSSQIVAKDSYVCAMRPGHPAGSQELTLDAYLELKHIHISSRQQGAAAVDIALRRRGIRRQFGLQMQNYYSVVPIVLGTEMVVTLTRDLARRFGLQARPLPLAVKPLEIHLYRHIRSDGDAAIDWLFSRILDLSQSSGQRSESSS
ncbi:LysR family transcriptional regulator [Phaeobacter gallaeciensis]|nr:LysR family transcriptional regulator [Phaeobacter gallaeciensis]